MPTGVGSVGQLASMTPLTGGLLAASNASPKNGVWFAVENARVNGVTLQDAAIVPARVTSDL